MTITTKEQQDPQEEEKQPKHNMETKTKHSYPPTIDGVYAYWFASGDLNSPSYVHNGKVWWKALPEVDNEIRESFGGLVEKALEGDGMFDEWKTTPKGTVALIIVLDQFTRNIYRGSAKMFAGDDQALELTKDAIAKKWDELVSLPERLFIYMPLQHTEDVTACELGVTVGSALVEAARAPGSKITKYLSLAGSFERHAAIVKVFGRYPHRNQVLGRISTPEEEEFLQKSLPVNKFMRSVSLQPPGGIPAGPPRGTKLDKDVVELPQKKPLAKVVMLHSFRQNAQIMKKRTTKLRKAFAAVGIEIVYVNAPIAYEAQGEDKDTVVKAFGKLPPTEHQRCFWMSQDDNNVYEGVDVSIRYLSDLFASQGPFLGVMAFSHGGAMGAILAALQPFESVKFSFGIFISAFPARAVNYKDHFTPNKQKIPSLHIIGQKDLLVDPERSRALAAAFQDSVILEHNGGHFVPDTWPAEAMAKFAAKFIPSQDGDAVAEIAPVNKDVVLDNFISKLEATIVNSTYAEPIGISLKAKALLSEEEFWKTWTSTPLEITSEGTRKFVTKALESASSPEEQDVIAEDLFVIAYSARVLKIPNFKVSKNPHVAKTDEIFCQVVTFVYLLSNYAARLLGLMTKYCGWRDLVGIAVQAHRIASTSTDTVEQQKLKALIQEIVQMFASQLSKDLTTVTQPHAMPSSCILGAPRLGSSADKELKLGLAVALALHPINEKVSDLAKKTRAEKAYQKSLRVLSEKLKEASSADATRKQMKRTALETNYVAQFSHSLPVPTTIVNPEPEPVTVAPLDELAPLFDHLKNNYPVHQQISFPRGSLLPDGRLDLCKMVVGPTGIKPLLDCMAGNDSVKRLLLGNNIVGNQGAKWISEFIEKGSKLTTWYIAGNDITAEGIEPVCTALEGDMQVDQLWLKRNPLMPAGAIPLARLLTNNSYLQVLDLVNTGLLDEGTATIFKALEKNTTLRHLYLGTNGITAASAGCISTYLAEHNKLQSLYLSLNRIGDEGAKTIAEGLKVNKNLERFCLASNRLTSVGISAVVEAVKSHPTIVLLDFGFTKATTTLGEIGNLMGDEGAKKIAELLQLNSTLRSLDVLHNNIGQIGLNALRDALRTNTSLTTLNYTQFGKASNELVKEETKLLLQRNCTLAGDKLPELQKIDFPQHIVEILSVYRTHV